MMISDFNIRTRDGYDIEQRERERERERERLNPTTCSSNPH